MLNTERAAVAADQGRSGSQPHQDMYILVHICMAVTVQASEHARVTKYDTIVLATASLVGALLYMYNMFVESLVR